MKSHKQNFRIVITSLGELLKSWADVELLGDVVAVFLGPIVSLWFSSLRWEAALLSHYVEETFISDGTKYFSLLYSLTLENLANSQNSNRFKKIKLK
jgi:hypothetical protein